TLDLALGRVELTENASHHPAGRAGHVKVRSFDGEYRHASLLEDLDSLGALTTIAPEPGRVEHQDAIDPTGAYQLDQALIVGPRRALRRGDVVVSELGHDLAAPGRRQRPGVLQLSEDAALGVEVV